MKTVFAALIPPLNKLLTRPIAIDLLDPLDEQKKPQKK
jgi:hypothetical protein